MVTERANAKINLFLSVGETRADGYHDLASAMQTVSLCDTLTIQYLPGEFTKIRMEISGADGLPTDCRNLAYRAAEAFLKKTGRRGEVEIKLTKRIPMAAGLGGGSADAAAVLRGLNKLCGSPLSKEELCALGEALGADVPFCILGGCAYATGVGERLLPFSSLPQDLVFVVACGGEGVSTKEAYALIDESREAKKGFFQAPAPDLFSDALAGEELARILPYFCNDFEGVIEPLRPTVTEIKSAMKDCGAIFSMMSGSGPSVFGIFPDLQSGDSACQTLQKRGIAAFLCHPAKAYFPN